MNQERTSFRRRYQPDAIALFLLLGRSVYLGVETVSPGIGQDDLDVPVHRRNPNTLAPILIGLAARLSTSSWSAKNPRGLVSNSMSWGLTFMPLRRTCDNVVEMTTEGEPVIISWLIPAPPVPSVRSVAK